MNTTKEEVKRRFDGSHNQGTLTFFAVGASPRHELLTGFVEVTDGPRTTRLECQMTPDQAKRLVEMLNDGLNDLVHRH